MAALYFMFISCLAPVLEAVRTSTKFAEDRPAARKCSEVAHSEKQMFDKGLLIDRETDGGRLYVRCYETQAFKVSCDPSECGWAQQYASGQNGWCFVPDNCGGLKSCTPISAKEVPSCRSHGKVVAIFADYDGCFDVAAAANDSNLMARLKRQVDALAVKEKRSKVFTPQETSAKLLKYLDSITSSATEVILFVGSNRQSESIERINMRKNRNGHSMNELEKLAKLKQWSFNKARLDDDMTSSDVDRVFGMTDGSAKLKKLMTERNLRELMFPAESIDVYFIDDVPAYLDKTIKDANIPPHINFHTVWFDHLGLTLGDEGSEKQLSIRESKTR